MKLKKEDKMKKSIVTLFMSIIFCFTYAQDVIIPPSNRSASSLEKNLLFFANKRFSVTQSGSTSLPLDALFDGYYMPAYSSPINPSDPYVILIENLSETHVQAGAWIGWTTRYYHATRFKIEIFNNYQGANNWITVSDENNYSAYNYMLPISGVSVGKIRFTFYNTDAPSNELGISELFFIHPEATSAYDNLMVKYNGDGNVGIGTADLQGYKLAVNGKIRAREIKVEASPWPDYVFEKSYQLTTLQETEKYIKEKGHLPGIPSAAEVKANGIDLGEMNAKLLKKIEELTLYLIKMTADNEAMKDRLERLEKCN